MKYNLDIVVLNFSVEFILFGVIILVMYNMRFANNYNKLFLMLLYGLFRTMGLLRKTMH